MTAADIAHALGDGCACSRRAGAAVIASTCSPSCAHADYSADAQSISRGPIGCYAAIVRTMRTESRARAASGMRPATHVGARWPAISLATYPRRGDDRAWRRADACRVLPWNTSSRLSRNPKFRH
jgi:hypothetical protein